MEGFLSPNRLGLRGCGKKTHSSLPGFARNSRCQFLENSFDRGSKHRGKDEFDILKMATSITIGIVAIKPLPHAGIRPIVLAGSQNSKFNHGHSQNKFPKTFLSENCIHFQTKQELRPFKIQCGKTVKYYMYLHDVVS